MNNEKIIYSVVFLFFFVFFFLFFFYVFFPSEEAFVFSLWSYCITKTCLYNFDPLKTHFYIVKLGFTGVYISFQTSAQNIDCGYSLEPPR